MNIRRFLEMSCLLPMLMAPSLAAAVEWEQTWSARGSTEYDSNPSLAPADPDGMWRYALEPGYYLKGKDDLNDFGAGVAVAIARSSNRNLTHDREDPNAYFDWRRQREQGSVGVSARYSEVDTRVNEIRLTGPGLAEGTRASSSLSANLSQSLSLRSALALDAAYEDVAYKNNTSQTGILTDYVSRSIGLMLSSAISESGGPYLRVGYVDSQPAQASGGFQPTAEAPISRHSNAVLGWNWKVSEYLSGSVQGGQSRTGSRKGSLGAAAVQYVNPRGLFTFNIDRQVVPTGLGLGGFVTRDQMKGVWTYSLSEISKAGIDLGWSKTRNIGNTVVSTIAEAWLQKEINASWGSRIYYHFRVSEGSIVEKGYAHILGVALTYSYSVF